MKKIKRIHLLIVAVILFVGLAAAFIMVLVKPRQKSIAILEADIAKEQKVVNQRPQAEAELAGAKAQRAAAEAQWQMIMRTKMSQISLDDPYRAIFAIYKEIPTYEPQLVAAFAKDKRVKLNSKFGFSQYGFTPPPQTLVGRVYPQSINLSAPSFPDLLSWLSTTQNLPRVLELGSSITLTKAANGINAAMPGTFHIYFAELSAQAQAQTAAQTKAPGTEVTVTPQGGGAPSRPTSGQGSPTAPTRPGATRPGMGGPQKR